MHTKKFVLVGLALALSLTAMAQTNAPAPGSAAVSAAPAPPANTGSFLTSVQDYFTSFNTNLDGTFGASKASLWTGVDSIQGGDAPLANDLGVSYNVYKQTLSIESVTRSGGVAGALMSEQAGIGFNVIVHDARLTLYADGGYDLAAKDGLTAKGKATHPNRMFGEIGLRAAKALTAHTYGFVGVAAQLPKNAQVFSAGVGITF